MKRSILFCIESLTGGGAEKVLIEILKNIDHQRYSIDLLVLYGYGVYFESIPEYVNWYTLKNAGNNLQKSFDIEVAFLEGDATRYIADRKSEAKKIAWVHIDLLTMHWTKKSFKSHEHEESCYSQMDKIIFVSDQVKSQFNLLFPNLKTEQQVIYNLIDRDNIILQANSDYVKKRKLTLCSIGRLVPQKGYIRLIPILDELKKKGIDFDFWIIGEGHQKQELEKLIEEHSLADTVFLMGFKKNPYPYLKAVDIFVLASFAEGFSLALCEAICLGKPVLVTQVSGADEILDNGKSGLIAQQDTLSIYKGLKKLIMEKGYREELGNTASIRSELFNVGKIMSEIHNLF